MERMREADPETVKFWRAHCDHEVTRASWKSGVASTTDRVGLEIVSRYDIGNAISIDGILVSH